MVIKLLNGFAKLGFTLQPADKNRIVRVPRGDNFICVPNYDKSLWLIKTQPNLQIDVRFCMIQPQLLHCQYLNFIHIHGDIQMEWVESLGLSDFEAKEEVDQTGNHIVWSVSASEKSFTYWKTKQVKRAQDIMQNFQLKITELLCKRGFVYQTAWGS
jgi:hypothetical protein